jgi:hypothetical protein
MIESSYSKINLQRKKEKLRLYIDLTKESKLQHDTCLEWMHKKPNFDTNIT